MVSSNLPMRLVRACVTLSRMVDDLYVPWVSGYPSLFKSLTVSTTAAGAAAIALAAAATLPGRIERCGP